MLRPHLRIDMVAIVQFAQEKHRETLTAGVITDWYWSELSKPGRAEFQRVVKDLRMLPRSRWGRPDYGVLDGGIGELRFKREDRQWRPLGFFAAETLAHEIIGDLQIENETEVFILTIGAFKKQGSKRGREHDNWTPREAKQTAMDRRTLIVDTGRIAVHGLEF
jgi:hypothetical protein